MNKPTAIRLDPATLQKARRLVKIRVSNSIICRVLLQAFVEGRTPIREDFAAEAARSAAAIKQGQHALRFSK